MSSKSLNIITEDMEAREEIKSIVNLRFTHKKAPMTLLERLTFKEPSKMLKETHALNHVKECQLPKSCLISIYLEETK